MVSSERDARDADSIEKRFSALLIRRGWWHTTNGGTFRLSLSSSCFLQFTPPNATSLLVLLPRLLAPLAEKTTGLWARLHYGKEGEQC
jgi:hypothetical protein